MSNDKNKKDPTSPSSAKKGGPKGRGARRPDHDHGHGHDHDTRHEPGFGRGARRGPAGRDPGPEFGRGPGPDFGGRGRGRARRGEVRNGVITLLAEGPQHGYQIIQELGARSGGVWTPSPGSVYPILQRLSEAGVVEAEDMPDGRRVFRLTATGQVVAERLAARGDAPWTTMARAESDEARELRRLAAQFEGAISQVAEVATPDQLARAGAIVADARRRLYALLAEEPSESADPSEPTAATEPSGDESTEPTA